MQVILHRRLADQTNRHDTARVEAPRIRSRQAKEESPDSTTP